MRGKLAKIHKYCEVRTVHSGEPAEATENVGCHVCHDQVSLHIENVCEGGQATDSVCKITWDKLRCG